MKIKKIQWENDPVLGNMILDFSDSKGNVYNSIILAGENGIGKTTIIESIEKIFVNKKLDGKHFVKKILWLDDLGNEKEHTFLNTRLDDFFWKKRKQIKIMQKLFFLKLGLALNPEG